ncbi:hypothetical protein C8Q78DRAFT_1083342 [Trametes maxima]|nr:hypothetical protein C8Q78DRAFT_1083342 [Trametes maxima]
MHLQHQSAPPNANTGHHPIPMPPGSRAEPRRPQSLSQESGVQSQGYREPAQGNHQNYLPPPQSAPSRSQPVDSPRNTTSDMTMPGMRIPEGSNMQARQLLEPLRQCMVDGLAQSHQRLTNEFMRLHSVIAKTESTLTKTEKLNVKLQQEHAKERALRENAERRCGQLQSEKEAVELEMQRLNEHLPKLLLEYYEVRGERDRLTAELEGLRDTNSQLREKVVVERKVDPGFHADLLLDEFKPRFKTEGRTTAPSSPCIMKAEGDAASPPSTVVADHDIAVAQALAEAHEERKRRERLEHELEVVKTVLQTRALRVTTVPPSVAEYTPPSTADRTPPTPSPETEPPLPTNSEAPASTDETANAAVASASLPTPKAEQYDCVPWSRTASEMGADTIDLTDVVSMSPMQLTPDLPPLARSADDEGDPERKRSLEPSSSAEGCPPSPKRRRTLDVPARWPGEDEIEMVSSPTTAPTAQEKEDRVGYATTHDVDMTDEPQQVETHAATSPSPGHALPTPELEQPPSAAFQCAPLPDVMAALSLPSSSAFVQLPGHPPPTPTSPTAPDPPKRLSMRHIPLIYITQGDKMHCRMCKRRTEDPRCKHLSPRPFILDEKTAKWADMAGHCEREHPQSFKALVSMSPNEIEEHLRRLNSGVPSVKR